MWINSNQPKHRHNIRYGDRSFYKSAAWRNTRNAFIQAHPHCAECGAPATVADHRVRVKDGGAKLDWSNLVAMCAPCHNRKDNNAGRKLIAPLEGGHFSLKGIFFETANRKKRLF